MSAEVFKVREFSRRPRFPLGQTVTTPGVLESVPAAALPGLLARHQAGDWGDLDAHDRAENELSLREGLRLLSAYTVAGVKVWVITEADRSATTILLPEEY